MKFDVILAGVGGQGILSIAYVLDRAALAAGYRFKQAEVHGMAQRGGAVQSHLRIADYEIRSDLIPHGEAELVLAVEPLEALRYVHFLKPDGTVVSSSTPFIYDNIPNYPEPESVYARIEALAGSVLVPAETLARRAGTGRASNMVVLGAASHLLPFPEQAVLDAIAELFRRKGERVVATNHRAFDFGKRAAALYRAGREAGLPLPELRRLLQAADPLASDPEALPRWIERVRSEPSLLDVKPHTLAVA